MTPSNMTREEGLAQLPGKEEVQKLVAGRQIVKTVFVPGRLLNIVVKG